MTDEQKAADVARAADLLWAIKPDCDELCAILRRWVAGLPPEQADKALSELFYEIGICQDVEMEGQGYCRYTPET